MNGLAGIIAKLPPPLAAELSLLAEPDADAVREIRLICGQKMTLRTAAGEKSCALTVTREMLRSTLNNLIKYSYYAYEEDMARGFVTIEGGHRVGICGKAVLKNGQPSLIREISSMNIRFAREIRGCAGSLTPYLLKDGRPQSILIVSPPGCGKTTLLRDMARCLSIRGVVTAVCDERSEIAGMYNSLPSFDLGPRTDVLDGCDKIYGIPMLIRSMAPQVIITDEIGKKGDASAAALCMNSGVALVTSVHGSGRSDAEKSDIGDMLVGGYFSSVIYLSAARGPGTIERIEQAGAAGRGRHA